MAAGPPANIDLTVDPESITFFGPFNTKVCRLLCMLFLDLWLVLLPVFLRAKTRQAFYVPFPFYMLFIPGSLVGAFASFFSCQN